MRWLLVFLGFFLTLAAQAQVQGFASHDLTSVVDQARIAIDTKASVQATPLNLTMTCAFCKGSPVVDIRLGRLTDGTEKRVRSGETTFAKLESLCIKQNPDCRLSTLPVSPAIGWLTVYAFGNGAGSTAVILRDGDLLTIQAKADSRWHAEESVRALVQRLAPRIVGP